MNRTKKIIVTSFKRLMKKKPFDKISIGDITEVSGLKRQTFYYHFSDKYELLNYIYYYEIFLPLTDALDSTISLQDALSEMFKRIEAEKYLYINALKMNTTYGFKEYLYSIMKKFIMELYHLDTIDTKEVEISLYAHGIVGLIIDWIIGNLDIDVGLLAKTIVAEINVRT